MPQEIEALLAELAGDRAPVERAGRLFHRGHLGGSQVVVAHSRWGKVAAAATATAMILEEGVDALVFTGVAGGIGPGVAVGDFVIGSELIQHDLDASPIFPRHQVPMMGRARLPADERLVAHASLAARAYAGQLDPTPSVHVGLVASGDQFISDSAVAAELGERLPGLLCVEMEGAAVAQVAAECDLPFVVVRTVSDRADEHADIDFLGFLETRAAPASLGIVRGLVERLAGEVG